MKDRRSYSRIKVNIPVTLYTDGFGEISGTAIDLSEDSLGILISKSNYKYITMNSLMRVQFLDKFEIGNTKVTEIITVSIIAVRAESVGNTINLGCIVRDSNFDEYVIKKKFADYYNKTMNN